MGVRRVAPESAVAIVTLTVGLWGYFTFFVRGDTDDRDLGVTLLLGAYALNGLLQACVAFYVRADLPLREKLTWGFDSWPERNGPSGATAALVWFGPVVVGLVVMLVATPASVPSGDRHFGIHTAILLLSLLGLAFVPLGAMSWLFAVLPLTALVGALLPDRAGRQPTSRAEIIARSWILPVTAVFATIVTFGRDLNRSELGRWLVNDFGLPLPPAAFLALLSIAVLAALVIVHQRARTRAGKD